MKLPQRSILWGTSFRKIPIRTGFGAILLLSIFAWAPATYPGYWQALEGFIPTFNVTQANALATVGIVPDLWRGIGQATFLLSRPFVLFGSDPTTAVRIGFILYCLLGSLSCYSWLQPRFGDRAAGLAGVLYLFAPPLLATIYIRGSLSDVTIIALLPLALAGLASYRQQRSPVAAGVTVIAILWMWHAQAGLALFSLALLLAYALLVERSWLAVLIVVVSGLAGATSLAAVWPIRANAPVPFADHFVYFFQLFDQQWRSAPSIPGWQDDFPFQLGSVALLYSVLYALFALRPRLLQQTRTAPLQAEIHRLWLFGCGVIVLFTAFTLPWSAPLWQWSQADRLLTYPWQLLLLTVPFWAVTGGALPTVHQLFRKTPLWVVLLFTVVLGSYSYLRADFTQIQAPATPVAFIGLEENIVVLQASLTENRQPHAAELTLIWQALRPLPFDYNIFFQALERKAPPGETSLEEQDLTVVAQL
ncbi:MAG: hypothetical protein KDE31_36045, partial [Caldilineaceae bacterium]|nr:hypothetical protein [Caldilineaceae bacterium]